MPLSKEIETKKQYSLYKVWRDQSIAVSDDEDDYGNSNRTLQPIIVIIIPGHAQSYREFQKLSNTIAEQFHSKHLYAEVYTLDFLEQPTGYSGQMVQLQARFLQKAIYSILNKHEEGTYFQLVGVDSGISVAYTAVGLEFPLSYLLGIISIQSTPQRNDIHQKYVTRSKEVIFEEAIKKLPYMLREMIVHVSIKACFQKPVSSTRSFYDIYEGKLKHQIEIETDKLQGIARCYDENEEIIKNKNFANVIANACQIILSKELYQASERLYSIKNQLSISLTQDQITLSSYETSETMIFSRSDVMTFNSTVTLTPPFNSTFLFDSSHPYFIFTNCSTFPLLVYISQENKMLQQTNQALQINGKWKMMQSNHRDGEQLVIQPVGDKCIVNVAKEEVQRYQYQQSSYFDGLVMEYIPLQICSDKPLMLTETFKYVKQSMKNIRFLRSGCSYLLYNKDVNISLVHYTSTDQTKQKVTIETSVTYYLINFFYNLRHLLYLQSVLLFLLLFTFQVKMEKSMLKIAITKAHLIIALNTIHSFYLYLLQCKIAKYGFLEHDDYQEYFQTFTITKGMLILMPFVMYASGVAFIAVVTIIYKGILGYVPFMLFQWLPEKAQFLRKFFYGILGIVFMMMMGIGYFMNLYYMFVLASIFLYWSNMFKYGQASKKYRTMENVSEGLKYAKKEMKSHWLLSDTLLLNMILLSLHWDRFVLETWRFIDFERTFTYAYDAEGFFIYPIFLFQVGVLVIHQSNLHETLSRVTIYFLYLVILPGYLLCLDYIYRLRLLLTVGLMFSAASLALSTCFNLAQRHQLKKYNDSLKRKVAKRKKKLLKEQQQQQKPAPPASTTKAWLDEFDIAPSTSVAPNQVLSSDGGAAASHSSSSASDNSASDQDDKNTSLGTKATEPEKSKEVKPAPVKISTQPQGLYKKTQRRGRKK